MQRLRNLVLHHKTALALSGGLVLLAAPAIHTVAQARNTSPPQAPHSSNSQRGQTTVSSSTAASSNSTNSSTSTEDATTSAPTNKGRLNQQTHVSVNGQTIDVPANGQVQQTVSGDQGETHVQIDSQQHVSSNATTGQSSSSLRISTHSQGQSQTEVSQEIQGDSQ